MQRLRPSAAARWQAASPQGAPPALSPGAVPLMACRRAAGSSATTAASCGCSSEAVRHSVAVMPAGAGGAGASGAGAAVQCAGACLPPSAGCALQAARRGGPWTRWRRWLKGLSGSGGPCRLLELPIRIAAAARGA